MQNEINPEEALGINGADQCFCGSGTIFRFCCHRIADKIIRALTLADDGRYKAAIRTLKDLEPAPGSAEVHGIRAQVFAMMDDNESVDKELELAFAINPNYPRGFFILGNRLFEEEKFSEALAMYDRAIDNYPETSRMFISEALASKGYCFFQMGNLKSAKETWRRGIELDPDDMVIASLLCDNIYDNPDASEELARKDEFYYRFIEPAALAADEEFDFEDDLDEESLSPFDLEDELDDETIDKINSLTKKAIRAIEKGKNASAIDTLEQALEIYPFMPNALMTLFYLYGDAGRVEEAIDCLYELSEIAEEPEQTVMALGGITSFKFVKAINQIFPMLFRRGKSGASALMKTCRINLSDPDKAMERIEASSLTTDRAERKNGYIEYFRVGASEKKRAKPDEFFFLRLFPGKNLVCLDTLFPDSYSAFLAETLDTLGDSVEGSPGEPFDTTLFSAAKMSECVLDYDDDLDLEDDLDEDAVGDEEGEEDIFEFEVATVEECLQTARDFAVKFFEQEWLNIPAPGLGGLTPLEASVDEEYGPLMPGIVANIEGFVDKAVESDSPVYAFSRLRKAMAIVDVE